MNIIVYALSVLLLVCMGRTVILGRNLRKLRRLGVSDETLVDSHRWGARISLFITITSVFLVEGMMIARYGWHARPHLPGFALHFWGFAVPFFILLLLCVFLVTGERFPKLHRIFVYACAAWCVPMVITGDFLVHHLH